MAEPEDQMRFDDVLPGLHGNLIGDRFTDGVGGNERQRS